MKKFFLLSFILILSGCAVVEEHESSPPIFSPTETEPASTQSETDETSISIDDSTVNENLLYKRFKDIELLDTLDGNEQKVWSLAAAENGYIISGGQDSQIIVWNAENLETVTINKDHSALVEDILVLKNGDILSISDDRTIRKLSGQNWDSEILYQGNISRFAVNDQEDLIAVSSGNNDVLNVFSFPEFKEQTEINLTHGCFEIRFSPDSTAIFTVGHEGKVQKWSAETGEFLQEYVGLTWDVHCLEITEDGQYLAAGSTDQRVMVWELDSGKMISQYSHYDGLYDLDISQDGKLIASVGVDRTLFLAELQTGKVLTHLRQADEIHAVAFDPNGRYIVSGGYDSVVYVWGFPSLDFENLSEITLENVGQVTQLGKIQAHDQAVFELDLSADDRLIASAGRDNLVLVWDIHSGNILRKLEVDTTVVNLGFSNNNQYLLAKGEMGNLMIWDLIKDELIFESKAIDKKISGFDLSKDNQLLVTGGLSGEVVLWDFPKMEPLMEAAYKNHPIMNILFSPDDSQIFYSYVGDTQDFSTYVIERENYQPVYQLAGHQGYTYSTDFSNKWNITATAGADHLIKFWDFSEGTLINTLDKHTGKVMEIDFSFDENILVSGSAHDKTIRLWNVENGEELKTFWPGGEVQCVEFANSGKFFVSSGQDGYLRLWGIEPE